MDINLNLYRIFYITAFSKTILEASDKLCISQPAVSKSIKKLEELLDVKLFYRNKNGIQLTKDGKILFEYIDKSYNYLLAGQKMIEDIKVLKKGTLVIGVPSHIACFYVLKPVKKIMALYPDIKIRLTSASTSILIEDLYNHKIDIMIDSPPINIDNENIVIEKLHEDLLKDNHQMLQQGKRKNKFSNSEKSFIYTTKCLCSRALDYDSPSEFCNKNNDLFIAQDGTIQLCRLIKNEINIIEELKNRDNKNLTKKLKLAFENLGKGCPYER